MRFASALSEDVDSTSALADALGRVTDAIDGDPDLIVAFATPHHHAAIGHIASVTASIARDASFGCIAEGVVAGEREIDRGRGLVVWAARVPGGVFDVAQVEAIRVPQGVTVTGGPAIADAAGVVVLADPFTFPAGSYGTRLAKRGIPAVGGVPNAGRGPGGGALFANGEVFSHGAVAASFGGALEFRPKVSQGCRPLGEPIVVTDSSDRVLKELAGRSAFTHLQDMFSRLSDEDRALARHGLHIGIVMDEYQAEYSTGDFLIRAVTGIDQATGTIEVGDKVPVGRTVQFQVRDPGTADVDLREVLDGGASSGGVLLFTCNGRGERFFGESDHDAALVASMLRPPALAGMFAAGEMGPVGSGNYLHGFTASLVEIRPTTS